MKNPRRNIFFGVFYDYGEKTYYEIIKQAYIKSLNLGP